MASGLVHRLRVESGIEAIVNVQANPGATIYLTESYQRPGTSASGGSTTTYEFQAVADTTTGIATITVNKPGTWYINTSVMSSTVGAVGNTASIDISESGTYSAQMVKINKGYTDCGCTNAYKSNTLLVWWNGTQPTEYFSGWSCIDTSDNSEQTGKGTTYQISTSITYRGFLNTVSSGTTKSYKVSAFVTINGKNYYCKTETVSGTAKTISLKSFVKYTSSTTVTVPEGCHSITAYAVGGGGGGGTGIGRGTVGEHTYNYTGGGGGGGRTSSKTIACLPGQSISVVIGGGGATGGGGHEAGGWANNGGTTSITVNNTSCIASGGDKGKAMNGDYLGGWGGDGGSGGGTGISKYYSTRHTSDSSWNGVGGSNGSNGGGAYASNSSYRRNGAAGQKTSTKINGTLYAGGGGAGSYSSGNSGSQGASGGSGGGGNGAGAGSASSLYKYPYKSPSSGTANTGGGGGGGGYREYVNGQSGSAGCYDTAGASGGSGVAFITFNAA